MLLGLHRCLNKEQQNVTASMLAGQGFLSLPPRPAASGVHPSFYSTCTGDSWCNKAPISSMSPLKCDVCAVYFIKPTKGNALVDVACHWATTAELAGAFLDTTMQDHCCYKHGSKTWTLHSDTFYTKRSLIVLNSTSIQHFKVMSVILEPLRKIFILKRRN
jgi:hypothetical protein